MEYRSLGNTGLQISCLGLGCWAIGGHGWGRVDENESIKAVRCAFENGVTFFDTADAYGLGNSESLLATALGKHRKKVVIATKGGVRWDKSREVWTDNSPAYLRTAVEDSLRRLKLEQIPLYYIHKPDGRTSVTESMEALERLRGDGKIAAVGLSNFPVSDVLEALKVGPVSAVQARLNLFERAAGDAYFQLCVDNDITFVAWGALFDGLLTGKFGPGDVFGADDHRSRMVDFVGDRFTNNLKCVAKLRLWAERRKMTVSQLALRWIMDSSSIACPLFGAKTETQVLQNLDTADQKLSREDVDEINGIVSEFRR